MREIKFRGKRTDNGKWVEGYYTVISGTHYISNQVDGEMYYDHQVIPETVGQYTGVESTDNIKLYEGDIGKTKLTWYEIVFYNGSFCAKVIKQKAKHSLAYELNSLPPLLHVVDATFVLIGNVQDNPELLK